jgi:hypothetical protein
MSRINDILKLHASHPTYSDFRITTVRQALLLLYSYSHNTEAVRELKRKGVPRQFRLIFNNKLSHDLLGSNSEEELTLGIIVKIVTDTATMIINHSNNTIGIGGGDAGGFTGMNKNKLDAVSSILEVGLAMTHEHIEVFLIDNSFKGSAKQLREDFIPTLDNRLVKFASDAAKVLSIIYFFKSYQ